MSHVNDESVLIPADIEHCLPLPEETGRGKVLADLIFSIRPLFLNYSLLDQNARCQVLCGMCMHPAAVLHSLHKRSSVFPLFCCQPTDSSVLFSLLMLFLSSGIILVLFSRLCLSFSWKRIVQLLEEAFTVTGMEKTKGGESRSQANQGGV